MAVRKIDLMHKEFGFSPGNKCRGCDNLTSKMRDRRYYKCSVYGVSASEATDWALSWDACGMYNKEYDGAEIVRDVRPAKDTGPIPGQESMWGEL